MMAWKFQGFVPPYAVADTQLTVQKTQPTKLTRVHSVSQGAVSAAVGFLLMQAVPYRQAVDLCLLSDALTEQLLAAP